MQDHLPDPDSEPQFYSNVPARRLVAWVVDEVIIVALALLVALATFLLALLLFPLVLLAIHVAYRAYFLARNSATPGMRFVGIEIRGRSGARLSPEEGVLHTLAYTLIAVFVLPQIVSMVLMLTTPRGQGLHDMLLGTAAINRPL